LITPVPTRLAYLVSQYPSITHTYILREVRALREQGFEIEVISIRPPDRPPEQLSDVEREELKRTFTVLNAGVGGILSAHLATLLQRPAGYLAGAWAAVRLAQGSLPKTFSNLLYFVEAVVAGRQMQRRALSHLHTHYASTVALLVERVFPITFSATIHGSAEFDDVAGFYIAEKVARARFICGISQYGLSQLMRASDAKHWGKLEVCALGVDPSIFLPDAVRKTRESSGKIELLCVGSLAPAKGLHILIAAVDRLVRQGRGSLHLRLVGEGRERGELERTIAERGLQNNVTLEGSCNQSRVLDFYRQADLFVLASFAEGVPVVLMEAMAMEIPCIATWITGIPELIRHGVDGWLIPAADEEQLAAAIAHLVDDPELRRKLGKSARARVEEKYNLAVNTARLGEIYRRRLSIADK
jgi:glycosyltransferase involved in cell wall biosynthesis